MMTEGSSISLVIPVYNESATLAMLIDSIDRQILQPGKVIFVDAGSVDDTISLIKKKQAIDSRYRVIEAGRAMPGRARNIGVAHADTVWIAFTDAGIKLEPNWLQALVNAANENPEASIVYGNYHPLITTFFDKCATIAYVAPAKPGMIRSKFIASCLMKKEVWRVAGGFPDWRAAEDLVFMENGEKAGFKTAAAPGANVGWQLRPGINSTYKRFDLYSKWNVWAGRQAFWHYGIARQYALMLIPVLLAIFHSWYWILLLPAWILARVIKRILIHKSEFGLKSLFNPAIIAVVAVITLAVDLGTFTGWIKAALAKNPVRNLSTSSVPDIS